MKVLFMHSDKPRERILADAFLDGVRAHGDEAAMRALPAGADTSFDVACMVGVKSRELFQECARAGMRVVYLDKGYCRQKSTSVTRSWEYWRVSVGAHHPTRYLMNVPRPSDRAEDLALVFKPWRKRGGHILFAGSSAKYHEFYRLREPTAWARKIVEGIRRYSDRPIIYRPKPSWKDAVEIEGTRFSPPDEPLMDVLAGAHALVTHGSNACFEAMLAGVPSVVIGDAVAKPISSTDLAELENPRLASDDERAQWLSNLAYCQWTLPEMSKGEAWKIMRPQIYE